LNLTGCKNGYEMKLPLTGGCQCGALRYAIAAEPLSVYLCHCTDCQKQTGSAFGMSVLVPREALIYTSAHPMTWEKTADSGRKMDGEFCATCGVRIAHHPRANERVSVLAG